MNNAAIDKRVFGAPPFFSSRLLIATVVVLLAAMAAMPAANGSYYVSAGVLCAALLLVLSQRPSLETLLIIWFIATPVASYVVRFPWDRSVVTFNRATFALALVVLFVTRSRSALERLRFTAFETSWALLSVIAVLSALLKSHDFGGAARIAFDSFWLPLVAFHLARHHFRLRANASLILAGAMALAVCLAAAGAIEFWTGSDLFQYKGGDLFRAHERRVNGPYASDSSYSTISLILLVFLIEAPRVFSIRLDASARMARLVSIAAAVVAAVLPLFRGTAMAMALCWIVTSVAWRKVAKRQGRRVAAGWGWLLVIPILVMILAAGGYLDLSNLSPRLSNPHNVVGRLSTWNTAARAMTANPLFGVGLTEYQSYFNSTYSFDADSVGLALGAKAVDSPHSNFLWIGAELGIPALLIYLFAFGNLVLISWRGLSSVSGAAAAVCSLALIAAYVVPGLELTSGYYSDLNLVFFFLTGLLVNRFSVEETEDGTGQD